MPNWTFNKLTVIGDIATLSKFKETLKSKTSEEPLDAQNVMPYDGVFSPDAMRRLFQQKMDAALRLNKLINGDDEEELPRVEWPKPDETDWEYEHWGTKWGFCNSNLRHEDENRLVYDFDSAWGTPDKLMHELYRQWSTLTFEYQFFSPESRFEGYEIAMGGKVIEFEDGDLQFDDEGNPLFRILPPNMMDDDRFDSWVKLGINFKKSTIKALPARVEL
jgi:hypothetical protein